MSGKTPKDFEEASGLLWSVVKFMHYFGYASPILLIIGSYLLMPAMRLPIHFSHILSWQGSADLYLDMLIISWLGFVWIIMDMVVIVYRHTPSDMIWENLSISILVSLVLGILSGVMFAYGALGWWLALPTALSIADAFLVAFVGTNVALLKRLLQEEH